jgi:hypothetical protein
MTFAPVEKEPFTATDQQCFLLGYRAVCRELYQKTTVMDAIPFLRDQDKGRDLADQLFWQQVLSDMSQGMTAGLHDLQRRKTIFDKTLVQGTYADVCHYILETSVVPDVMATFGVTLQFDFEGNKLQDLSDFEKELESIYVSVIATDSGGAIVFTWIDETNVACEAFVRSLHKLNDEVDPKNWTA